MLVGKQCRPNEAAYCEPPHLDLCCLLFSFLVFKGLVHILYQATEVILLHHAE